LWGKRTRPTKASSRLGRAGAGEGSPREPLGPAAPEPARSPPFRGAASRRGARGGEKGRNAPPRPRAGAGRPPPARSGREEEGTRRKAGAPRGPSRGTPRPGRGPGVSRGPTRTVPPRLRGVGGRSRSTRLETRTEESNGRASAGAESPDAQRRRIAGCLAPNRAGRHGGPASLGGRPSLSACVGTRKAVIYPCARRSRGKPRWRPVDGTDVQIVRPTCE
jgi:hypothetical protein